MNIKKKQNGVVSHYVTPFTKCKDEYFTSKGIYNVKNANLRFCPNIEEIKDDWLLKNSYAYKDADRHDFDVEIVKCKDNCYDLDK